LSHKLTPEAGGGKKPEEDWMQKSLGLAAALSLPIATKRSSWRRLELKVADSFRPDATS
jgi:hypothetical protein